MTAVLAVVALALSIWALLESRDSASYSDSDRTAASAELCGAYRVALQAVTLQTRPAAPDAPEPAAAEVNARLALAVAAADLRQAVADRPAASAELRADVTTLAAAYQSVAVNYLAGLGNDSQPVVAATKSAGAAAQSIDGRCPTAS